MTAVTAIIVTCIKRASPITPAKRIDRPHYTEKQKEMGNQLTPLKSIFICETNNTQHITFTGVFVSVVWLSDACRCFYFRVNYYGIIDTIIIFYFIMWINSFSKSYKTESLARFVDSAFVFSAMLIAFVLTPRSCRYSSEVTRILGTFSFCFFYF